MQETMTALLPRSVFIHVKDTEHAQGKRGFLLPGEGTIDWPDIVRSLEAAGFSGWIMLELQRPHDDAAAYFKRAFERATAVLGGATAPRQGAAS